MLFFLNDVVDFFLFLIKVPSSFGLLIDAFLHDFVFRKQEVRVKFCLLDQTLDCLVRGRIGWGFERADLFQDDSFEFFLILGMLVIELHPAKCLISEKLFKTIATLRFIKLARFFNLLLLSLTEGKLILDLKKLK